MVWSCFSYYGLGPIVPVVGTMRQTNYLSTLRDYLLPQVAEWYGSSSCVFQHDNAPCHKARSIREFLGQQNFQVIDWPPYSPDLNPIENLWSLLKSRVHREATTSKIQLSRRIEQIWRSDPSLRSACKSLIESMPRRVQAVIDSRGGYTKY